MRHKAAFGSLVRIFTLSAAIASLGTLAAHAQSNPWVRNQGNRGVIVFVHGVTGDPQDTWSSSKAYWPRLLTQDATFKDQDIYVYHYPSPRLNQTLSIDEIANDMNSRLLADGVLQHDEITFVSHSAGGIVTRAFILRYRKSVESRIRFLYFFATPTNGSYYARVASLFSDNPQFRDILPMEPGTLLAQQLSDWLAAHFKFRSYCAYEGKAMYGEIIVDRPSASALCTEPPQAIDADHTTIVKPTDAESPSYVALKSAFLQTAAAMPASPQHNKVSLRSARSTPTNTAALVTPAVPKTGASTKVTPASPSGSNPAPTRLGASAGDCPSGVATFVNVTADNGGIGLYDPYNRFHGCWSGGGFHGNGINVAEGPLPAGTTLIGGTPTSPGRVLFPADKEVMSREREVERPAWEGWMNAVTEDAGSKDLVEKDFNDLRVALSGIRKDLPEGQKEWAARDLDELEKQFLAIADNRAHTLHLLAEKRTQIESTSRGD